VSGAAAAATVAERRAPGEMPLWVHPEWQERFDWLVQGTTGRGEGDEPFDLGLSGSQPVGPALERWRRLLAATGARSVVHARQVHGTELWVHDGVPAPGVLVMSGVDGHLAAVTDLLLAVSVADCVPVFLVDARQRAVALLHAGWRGVAGGILERGVSSMRHRFGTSAADLWLHCGPAICGPCYPVGAEVHRAVRPDDPRPGDGTPLDLRSALVERATSLGIDPQRCSVSAHCTRCGNGREGQPADRQFFSHRAGDSARQMAVLGLIS
jgi:polyphenol oxidase